MPLSVTLLAGQPNSLLYRKFFALLGMKVRQSQWSVAIKIPLRGYIVQVSGYEDEKECFTVSLGLAHEIVGRTVVPARHRICLTT